MRIYILTYVICAFLLAPSALAEKQKPQEYYRAKKPVSILRITNWPVEKADRKEERGPRFFIETAIGIFIEYPSARQGQVDWSVRELKLGKNQDATFKQINLQDYHIVILENIEALPQVFLHRLIQSIESGNAVILFKCLELEFGKKLSDHKKHLGPPEKLLHPEIERQSFYHLLGKGYVIFDPFNKGDVVDLISPSFYSSIAAIAEKITTRSSRAKLAFNGYAPKYLQGFKHPHSGVIYEGQILYTYKGSKVEFTITTNVDFESVTLYREDHHGKRAKVQCQVLPTNELIGAKSIKGTMHVEENLELILRLTKKDKKRIEVPFRIHSIPDFLPVIKTNAESGTITTRARIPFEITISDDNGLTETYVEYRINNGKFIRVPEELIERKSKIKGVIETINFEWMIKDNRPAPKIGDVIAFRIIAWDNNPDPKRKPSLSKVYNYRVVSDDEKRRELQNRAYKK